jgi:hypothetical protein
MPPTDEDILRDLMHHYTAGVYPDASVAAAVVARQRRREIRRRAGSAVAAGAALSVAAGVIAFVPGHVNRPAGGAGTAGAKPGGTTSAPAVTLTAGQRVLYQLSAAAAKQQPAQGRYVTLYEKEDGNLDTNVIDTQTGDDYGYQKGYNGAPSGVGKVDKHYSPTAAEFAAMPLDTAALRESLIAYYNAQAAAVKAQIARYNAKLATLVPSAKKRPVLKSTLPPPTANDMVVSQAMSFLWNPATPPALRAALFRVLAEMPAVQVDNSAHDMLGRPAVELSWTASDGTLYTVYENQANGTVLEQTSQWPSSYAAADGPSLSYDLMLRVTRTNTIPPDPYTS